MRFDGVWQHVSKQALATYATCQERQCKAWSEAHEGSRRHEIAALAIPDLKPSPDPAAPAGRRPGAAQIRRGRTRRRCIRAEVLAAGTSAPAAGEPSRTTNQWACVEVRASLMALGLRDGHWGFDMVPVRTGRSQVSSAIGQRTVRHVHILEHQFRANRTSPATASSATGGLRRTMLGPRCMRRRPTALSPDAHYCA